MTRPKIAVIVGNGFSISFDRYSELNSQYDSQSPLSWPVKCPSSKNLFLDSLPNLKRFIDENKKFNDFDIFKEINDLRHSSPRKELDKALLEARHYLTIAFSEYAIQQKSLLKNHGAWPWYQWFSRHRDEISCLVSFNYDILLESVFDKLNRTFFSLETNNHGWGIPLIKPHGSVDFEMAPNCIGGLTPSYPMDNYFIDENDTPIIRIGNDDLLKPRLQAHCIIPNEDNKYLNYQWVKPAYDIAKERLKECTHLVIIGHSYADSDKLEIDEILNATNKGAEIIVANPHPPEQLINHLKGRPVIQWSNYGGPVDDKGNLLLLKDLKTNKMLTKCLCGSGKSYAYCHGQETK